MKQALIDRVCEELTGKILHTAEVDGTVAVVEQRGDVRWYHAREFTKDAGEMIEAGGYSTADKYWYMGERYRSAALWGEYLGEVYKIA